MPNQVDQKNLQSKDSQQTPSSYNDLAYVRGSAAINGKELYALEKYFEEFYQTMAQERKAALSAQNTAVTNTCTAISAAGDAKASSLDFQAGEAAAGSATAFGSMYGSYRIGKSAGTDVLQEKLNNLSKFADGAKAETGADVIVGHSGGSKSYSSLDALMRKRGIKPDSPEEKAVMRVRDGLRSGSLKDLEDVKSLDESVLPVTGSRSAGAQDVTYREVLKLEFKGRPATATSKAVTPEEAKRDILKNITDERDRASRALNSKFSEVQTNVGMLQSATGAIRDGLSSGMRGGQSVQATAEAAQNSAQQQAQMRQQFMKTAESNEEQAYQGAVQNASQAIRTREEQTRNDAQAGR